MSDKSTMSKDIVGPLPPNELLLCDDEIRAVFAGTQYLIGTPTMMQVVKELRLLRGVMEKLVEQGAQEKGT